MTTTSEIITAQEIQKQKRIAYAREHSLAFARYTMPNFQDTWFHKNYYKVLDYFIKTDLISKLIVSCPPQHGKSQGSSINTPAMMIGKNPDLKIATVCYSATKARKFGRKVKQLLKDEKYIDVFGNLTPSKKQSEYSNTGEEMEIVGHDGFLKNVGYQGGLTGDPIDVLLMDDLYKDWKEAKSPLIRENVVDWYNSTADTRLHNDSKQLIVFTRWDEDDLVGYIESKERVITIKSFDDIEQYKNEDVWFKINFEAIKTTEPTNLDPREIGESLWPSRHSLEKLKRSRSKDPIMFDCLHQGNPSNKEGLLYSNGFEQYTKLPDNIVMKRNNTDTADQGADYLCSINWDESSDGYAYVRDVLYTQKPMEDTEPLTANLLHDGGVRRADIESNNGGKGFARKIAELLTDTLHNKTCGVEWFHQSENKEARIISNSATVMERVRMPIGWEGKWPEFYAHVMRFKRVFKANEHDDAVDVLTAIAENLTEPIYETEFNDNLY